VEERRVGLIGELHAKNYYAYGYRRMWKAVRRAGEPAARCTVQRLMREQGIQGAKRRGKPWRTTKPDPEAQRRPYLVGREFSAAVPIGWVADLSYPAVLGGARLLAFVLDAYGPHRGARSNVVRDGGPALSSARRLRRRLATAAAAGTR
jgi:putative transposase